MISYRALKKLIGETSLERKCRFLFGLALLVLITTSFYLYAARTRTLVESQQINAARGLADRFVFEAHYQKFIGMVDPGSETSSVSGEAAPPAAAPPNNGDSTTAAPGAAEPEPESEEVRRLLQQVRDFEDAMNRGPELSSGAKWRLIDVGSEPGIDSFYEARRRFRDAVSEQNEYSVIRDDPSGSRQLEYYKAIRIRPGGECVACHQRDLDRLQQQEQEQQEQLTADAGTAAITSAGDTDSESPVRSPLFAIARIELSMETVESQLSRNRAVLLASGIVTSFLAMMASYAIVRYIIVKPVLHLKDVSDEIARGNLNLRADINTGDEFEELGHAFNRMLRHMMTVNDELRGLNLNLDGKVDQLARVNMELFNSSRLKDDFLATMSHELRTPLNSILGFSDILQNAANLDERQKRYVHNIQTSGQSLMVQINDLLDLAKIESGKMDVHLDDVQIADIIDQQVQQVSPLADRRKIDLRIEQPLTSLPLLRQDRGKISQILNNLLSNAIKFTPEGGRVRVSFRRVDADTIEFSVEDTGIGIPLHEQEHIFEKFRQGSTALEGRDHVTREYEGTGLGLSIVRELSRLLGGDVSLQSEFGKGSLFVVRLPLDASAVSDDVAPLLESRSSSGLGRITSVDLMSPPKSTAESYDRSTEAT